MNALKRAEIVRMAVKRILLIPVAMFVVVTASFALVSIIPGDPALLVLGEFATDEQIQDVRQELGLNDPFLQRYGDYLNQVIHGDLGESLVSQQSVAADIAVRLPNTLALVALGLAVALVLGTLVGTLSAYYENRFVGRLSSGVTVVLQSTPDFLLGLLLIFFLFYLAGVAPAPIGQLGPQTSAPDPVTHFLVIDLALEGRWGDIGTVLAHTVLPVATLGGVYSAYFARVAANTMGEALRSPQVEFARACGLRERTVIRYAFLSARTPTLTYVAVLLGTLIGGDAIIEQIFSWNGIGQWALNAILARDIPQIQGFIIVAGLFTTVTYLLLDMLVAVLDPRVAAE